MMGFFYLNNFIFECDLFNLLVYKKWILENSKNSKKEVVELGEEIGPSDYIELLDVENYIRKSEVSWVYPWKGCLLPFMEVMKNHNEHISMQFINS